jgi:hypothetical protein
MPLVESQQFKRDNGVIITCAQPIYSEKLAEIVNGFLQEITEWKDDPEVEDFDAAEDTLHERLSASEHSHHKVAIWQLP